MAKKPAKDTEKEPSGAEDGEGEGGSSKKKLFIMIGAGVGALVVLGGAGAFFMGAFSSKPAVADAHHAEVVKTTMYVDLPDITVNLSSTDQRAAFLKVKVSLEVSDKATVEKITPALPRVLDAFQIYLRELRVSDLDGSAGLYRVKEELQRRINTAIHPARVDAVLFKEILVQ
ncbi:flagellar basal body-associated protein FliL [Siculibacillus lacustris]|uniref:Flagellar protein FliL n=1 Tax=Siculibacillus lacustris TaxID=1549641 RepID=A0A4Q9VF43_9HYPH|nr:flagellar basal body-associated FliL family protein [Siculibacillus lacustris]TBW33490.1 flagellar basal body-associated protein FliL [Siculibacillus lacustris]